MVSAKRSLPSEKPPGNTLHCSAWKKRRPIPCRQKGTGKRTLIQTSLISPVPIPLGPTSVVRILASAVLRENVRARIPPCLCIAPQHLSRAETSGRGGPYPIGDLSAGFWNNRGTGNLLQLYGTGEGEGRPAYAVDMRRT